MVKEFLLSKSAKKAMIEKAQKILMKSKMTLRRQKLSFILKLCENSVQQYCIYRLRMKKSENLAEGKVSEKKEKSA